MSMPGTTFNFKFTLTPHPTPHSLHSTLPLSTPLSIKFTLIGIVTPTIMMTTLVMMIVMANNNDENKIKITRPTK